MAVGTQSDFQVFEDQFHGSFIETSMQRSMVFNERSRGAIRLVPERHRGDFQQESLFTDTSSLISRRDPTTDGSASALALSQDQAVRVKLNRRIGPIEHIEDAFVKIEEDPALAGQIVGEQAAKQAADEQLDRGVAAAAAALEEQGDGSAGSVDFDATDGTIQTDDLVKGLQGFGDRQGDVLVWVMHSKPFFDLLSDQISNGPSVENVAGFAVAEGSPVTLGRPVILTDATALVETDGVSSGTDEYHTLGLPASAVQLLESQAQRMLIERVGGDDNIKIRVQGEYAYSLGLRGYKFTTGTANPSDSAVATGSNWTRWASDDKLGPGVLIRSQ